MSPTGPGWQVERVVGPADELFRSSVELLSALTHRTVRFLVPETPVLVLGSAQRADIVSPGVPTVRRRSGGGAVWLDARQQVWADVLLPDGDHLWTDDVGESFAWLGEVWCSALVGLGVPSASLGVHRGALQTSRWSPLLCFAGVGPGEVLIGTRKVVGMSQRRTRAGALFQCGALLEWSFDPMLFSAAHWPGVPDAQVLEAGVGLRSILGPAVDPGQVEEALIGALVAAS